MLSLSLSLLYHFHFPYVITFTSQSLSLSFSIFHHFHFPIFITFTFHILSLLLPNLHHFHFPYFIIFTFPCLSPAASTSQSTGNAAVQCCSELRAGRGELHFPFTGTYCSNTAYPVLYNHLWGCLSARFPVTRWLGSAFKLE